jgi:hypothetical protein
MDTDFEMSALAKGQYFWRLKQGPTKVYGDLKAANFDFVSARLLDVLLNDYFGTWDISITDNAQNFREFTVTIIERKRGKSKRSNSNGHR